MMIPSRAQRLSTSSVLLHAALLLAVTSFASPVHGQTSESQRIRLTKAQVIEDGRVRRVSSVDGDLIARSGDTVSVRVLGDTLVTRFLLDSDARLFDLVVRDIGDELSAGDEVRWSPKIRRSPFHELYQGQVVRAAGDSLWVSPAPTSPAPGAGWMWSSVQVRGTRSLAGRRALIGGGVGFLMGVVIGRTGDGFGKNDPAFSVVSGVEFGALGAAIGAVAGLGRRGWRSVEGGVAVRPVP